MESKRILRKKCHNIWSIGKKVVPLHAFSGDLVYAFETLETFETFKTLFILIRYAGQLWLESERVKWSVGMVKTLKNKWIH
jgi:hypothetical protein